MRYLTRLAFVVVIGLAQHAHADEVADLIARGEQLAQDREYTAAIEVFKQADRIRPSAATACRIGLAYTRRELWPQAELFFTRCRERATPADPVPDWTEAAEEQLATKLAAANIAAITIEVKPSGVRAVITASAFATDETFSARTIHLGPGVHTLEIAAPGFTTVTREITVADQPQTITVELVEAKTQEKRPPVIATPRSGVRDYHIVLASAGALGLAALAVDLFAVKPARDKLDAATSRADYDANIDAYELRRNIDVGLALGAVCMTGIGLYLWRHDPSAPVVGAAVIPHGAMIGVGWTR